MKDDLYWELDNAQLSEWLMINGDPLEDKPISGVRIPYLPVDDIRKINKIIEPFRSIRPGTNEGGPVIYPIIDIETADRSRSGYCWFLEKPLSHFKDHYTDIEMMVHRFEEDWYLVKWVDNAVSWSSKYHWFVCDEISGVESLLNHLLN